MTMVFLVAVVTILNVMKVCIGLPPDWLDMFCCLTLLNIFCWEKYLLTKEDNTKL